MSTICIHRLKYRFCIHKMSTNMAGVKLRIQKRDNNKGHYYLEYYLGSKMVNGKQVAQRKREGLGLDVYLNPKNILKPLMRKLLKRL